MGGPVFSTTGEIYMQVHKASSITSTIFIKTLSLLWRRKETEN